MSETTDNHDTNVNRETPATETDCGPGCDCTGSKGGRVRGIIGIAILALAGALVARAFVKGSAAVAVEPSAGFSAGLAAEGTAQPTPPVTQAEPSVAVTEIASLAELNRLATDTDAVFVYLPGQGAAADAPVALLGAAVEAIKASNIRVGIFTLKSDAPEYPQLAGQMDIPGVIAMVKGKGMVPVQGEITKDKLVQAFVAASNAGGCGPSGCGPSGCN